MRIVINNIIAVILQTKEENMSYEIDAWLEEGEPQLQIIDADSGCLRLAWRYPKSEVDESDPRQYLSQLAIKELFQKLFLLASVHDIQRREARASLPGLRPEASLGRERLAGRVVMKSR